MSTPHAISRNNPTNTRLVLLQAGLERLGWTLANVEIDMSRETARIELRRGDLLVTFDARDGKATTTRERLRRTTRAVGRRGDRFLAEAVRPEFIGRERHEGARSGLRWLAGYLASNAVAPTLASDVRPLLALVMDGHRHTVKP